MNGRSSRIRTSQELRSGSSAATLPFRARSAPATAELRPLSFGNQSTQQFLYQSGSPDATGGAPQAQPKKSGTLEFTGAPQTFPLDQPSLNKDGTKVSTHTGRPQISWRVQVTQTGSLADCLAVGFLQTVAQNDVRADYSPAGRCSYDLQPLPIRDGFASSPVWYQASSGQGQGFGLLGTCQIPGVVPPGMSQTSASSIFVSQTDDPGGYFPLQHPKDASNTLRSIHEALTFHTWLAVRPQNAPEGVLGSYRFLQHMEWTVKRDLDIKKPASGGAAATTRTNEIKIVTLEDGQGRVAPNLGTATANGAVQETCTL
jgi:hypothetical protein